MIVKSLDLQNYRNYPLLHMTFSEDTNILFGDNAQGKTNILEAMYLAATTRSHRGSKDKEMIRFECEEAHIKMIVTKKDIDYRIDMHLKKNKTKGIAINGLPIKKAVDLFGITNIVLFSPEDLDIIKNGPSERRRFMDMELSQLDKLYVYNLMQYHKVLTQRNHLLKDIYYDNSLKDTLDVWNEQLIRYGMKVIEGRQRFLEQSEKLVRDIHSRLTGGKEQLSIQYVASADASHFKELVNQSEDKDIRFGTTSYGPHKDDIIFYINGNDVRHYGSQGQQRTVALSLKLSEIEFIRQITKDSPVLLLDDVLSELDSSRQNFLINSIGDIQTIITCTGVEEFVNNRKHINTIYQIVNGSVIHMTESQMSLESEV